MVSVLTLLANFAKDPFQLLCIRFLTCLGIGGCWPNGVALVSEAWSKIARPIMASLIGMAGNIGIFSFAKIMAHYPVDADSFRNIFFRGGLCPTWSYHFAFYQRVPNLDQFMNSTSTDNNNEPDALRF